MEYRSKKKIAAQDCISGKNRQLLSFKTNTLQVKNLDGRYSLLISYIVFFRELT